METNQFIAYDTACTVSIEAPCGKPAGPILRGAQDVALQVERTLSMFDETSELSRLCGGYVVGKACPVSDTLWEFIGYNLRLARLTDGAFDFTVGPLVKLWNFTAETPIVPSDAALRQALERVGYRHIHTDAQSKTVTFDRAGIGLDPGAAGKGFALGLAVDYLRGQGVQNAVVDFGGNLFVLGQKQTEQGPRPWRVAIRNPDDTSAVIGTVEMANRGIATSSWYEHCFEKGGKVYHHLINAATGRPMPLTLKSVSIVSSAGVYTDLLSTAFFMVGEEAGETLVRQLREETGEVLEYVVVREDGSVLASEGAGFAGKA